MNVVAERVALPVGRGVCLAPFALLRIAAVPYRSLRSLAPPKTTSLIRHTLNARQTMEHLRPLLENLLYRAIPAIGDRKTRGAALQLCRDVHNGRQTGGSDEVERILESLPDEQRTV